MKQNVPTVLNSIQHLQVGPLGPHIINFASLLIEQGYADFSMKLKIRLVVDFSKWMENQKITIDNLEEKNINDFIELKGIQKSIRRGLLATLKLLLRHFQNIGIIQSSPPILEVNPFENIECGFAKYLSQERGLSMATLDNYIPLVRRFLSESFSSGNNQVEKIRPVDVTNFILRYVPTVKRKTAQLMTSSLRAFFRYLHVRGRITVDLAQFVPTVAYWRLANIPKHLQPEEVESLLKNCDQSNPTGVRDYAILLLFARLGLRAGEVATMIFEDFNWEKGELIIRGKGPRKDRLPIPNDVGEAIVKYLKHGRPKCRTRCVFVRARAPYKGFSSSVALCNIVERALCRSNLQPPHKGAHLLRHSLANHMLQKGSTLTEIGEILRHQLPSTTEIYTKVDLNALSSVAQPWPGGEI